ncbi:MAG: tripartite tricarboxylate transporter substrate binding protein [Betaproteobacteria bacterium]|nr:tripartite tricarboxylate transporter substrate binding protein [Betaproteobacteria bacterium]
MNHLLAHSLLGLCLCAPLAAQAQDKYPSRTISIVSPFPPGGTSDLTARQLAPVLERIFKQPVTVQNRPGAAGATGAQVVANATPDGYTLILHLVSISALPERDKLFGTKPAYTRDQFVGIARLTADPPMLVVHPSLPVKNLKEFVSLAKKKPGEMIFSSSGLYGASHVPYEMFLQAAGLKMRHLPTTGGAPAMTAVLGGHAISWACPPNIAAPHLQSGKVRAYAQWGAKRLEAFPDVRTFKEQGYDIEYYLWGGLFAPKDIPPQVFNTLRETVRKAVADPDFIKGMEKIRTPIAYQDADEFKAFWDKDAAKLARVIQKIGKVAK